MAKDQDGCAALVLGTTGTPWKLNEQKVPFLYSFAKKRIFFKSFSRYGNIRATVEKNMTAEANLDDKMRNVLEAAAVIRNGGSAFDRFIYQAEKEGIFFKGGRTHALARTYMLADDTTQAIPTAIWDIIRPQLGAEYIIEDSLKAAPVPRGELPAGSSPYTSITDIGPILSATQQAKFWELVRKAAAQIEPYRSGKPVPVYHEVKCALICLADHKDKPYAKVNYRLALQLYTPNGLTGDVPVPATTIIPTTDDFLSLPQFPNQSVASMYARYVLEFSARKHIHDKICKIIRDNESRIQLTLDRMIANDNSPMARARKLFRYISQPMSERRARKKARALLAVQITHASSEDDMTRMIGETKVEKHNALDCLRDAQRPDAAAALPDKFLKATSGKFYFGGSENATHPDLAVLPTFDANDPVLRDYYFKALDDMIVKKATDPCCEDMQIIVMNKKDENGVGCYDDYVAKHTAYAISGYNKDYAMPLVHKGLADDANLLGKYSDVGYVPFYYFDKITHTDEDILVGAANKLILHHQKTYDRIEESITGTIEGGIEIPPDKCIVTVFASACSDRLSDYRNGERLGCLLEELDVALRSGAGDQHSMWFFVQAFLKAALKRGRKKMHISGATTHKIAEKETINGWVSTAFTHHAIYDDIGDRLEKLLQGHVYVSLGGGNGTGQETGTVLMLKRLQHPLARGKDMIFIGADESMYKEIQSMVSKEEFDDLHSNPYALKHLGIYLFGTTEEAEPQIRKSVAVAETRLELAAKPDARPTSHLVA